MNKGDHAGLPATFTALMKLLKQKIFYKLERTTNHLETAVGGLGKNKLDNQAIGGWAQQIRYFTFDDGSVLVKSGYTQLNRANIILNDHITITEDMILTGCPSGGASGTYKLQITRNDDNTVYADDTGSGISVPVSIFGNGTCKIQICLYKNVTFSEDLTFYPMLRPASIADSTYEPFYKKIEFDTSDCMKKGVDYVTAGQAANATLGRYATAEGFDATASGYRSHAEGGSSKATSDCAHAEGCMTTSSGDYAHAEGLSSTASGESSHAEGDNSTASGDKSHAEGEYTEARGDNSHAEGYETIANGDYSHAEGYGSQAIKEGSHAEGCGTKANGDYSHAGGYYTKTAANYQTVVGKYNKGKSNTLFEVGNGTGDSSSNRKNAFEVDESGNIIAAGTITDGNGNILSNKINVSDKGAANGVASLGSDGKVPSSQLPASSGPSPYASDPAMDGTASSGVSNDYARGDHVHPSDTSKLGVNDKAASASVADAVENSLTITSDSYNETYNGSGSVTIKFVRLTNDLLASGWSASPDSQGYYSISQGGARIDGATGRVQLQPGQSQSVIDAYNNIASIDVDGSYGTITAKTKEKPSVNIPIYLIGVQIS